MASHQSFQAGQAHSQGREKANQTINSAKESANTAADKVSSAAQSTHDSAQQQPSGGFLHQTGEKVANMAQGAAESVKNTLGMGDNNNNNNNNNNNSCK